MTESELLSILLLLGIAPHVHAQGPPGPPPGPPGDTMKTLQQVEPRTDLADVPGNANNMHVITAPGSYYLSDNLTWC